MSYMISLWSKRFGLVCKSKDLIEEIKSWISIASERGYTHILVVKDMTDGVVYPHYISVDEHIEVVRRCFISESKMKILEEIVVSDYSDLGVLSCKNAT